MSGPTKRPQSKRPIAAPLTMREKLTRLEAKATQLEGMLRELLERDGEGDY